MSVCTPIQESEEWQALEAYQAQFKSSQISQLFSADNSRFEHFSLNAAGIFFDYSKNLLDEKALSLLEALASKVNLQAAISAMFSGELVNNTEQRPALHVALRSPHANSAEETLVQATLEKMSEFTESIHTGQWQGYTGKAITDVINIGIGGSDLGPSMIYEALSPYQINNIRCHFVSNIDPAHLKQTLLTLDPATTLFIIASKTFTTLETLKNAEAAKNWLLNAAQDEAALPKHFIAVSSNLEKAKAFGILEENILPMWDWVGGRYSLWSAIGLPLALGLGMSNFKGLLAGAYAMDEHFRTAPLRQNMPVLMALLNIWYLNFFQAETQVILPYAQNLNLLPAFLQQLDMESLGKSVRKDGSIIKSPTGGIVWGSAGTNGQHSFHQLLHQGSHLIPADFIAVVNSHYETSTDQLQQQYLLANCFAQSQALMQGKSLEKTKAELCAEDLTEEETSALAPHKVVAGNRPSSTMLLNKLTPKALGSLIASYEHKVFSQSVILQINAFDQWGVELGKSLCGDLFELINGQADLESSSVDASTQGLISKVRNSNS